MERYRRLESVRVVCENKVGQSRAFNIERIALSENGKSLALGIYKVLASAVAVLGDIVIKQLRGNTVLRKLL